MSVMWALVVTVCLSGGGEAECRTWIGSPVETRGECVSKMPEVGKPLADLDPLYLSVRCVRGRYS